MRWPAFLLLASSLAFPLTAQEQKPPVGPVAPAADTPLRLYDFVVAMVGDKAILASEISDVWRARVQSSRETEAPTRLHLLWYETVEMFVGRDMQAQSARLMGRSPDEVEAQVERLVQDELRKTAEDEGGLNEYVRKLGVIGGSMNTVAEEARTRILYSMAHYQGILRELQDQFALLATPKEMHARFLEDPKRFDRPGHARVAARRVQVQADAAAAMAEAKRIAAEWTALPRPLTADTMTAGGAQILEVSFLDPASMLIDFASTGQVGDVMEPRADGPFLWVLAIVEKTPSRPGRFEDQEVQIQLRDEIGRQRRQEVYEALFQEQRIGVDRYPWGDPPLMEGTRNAGSGRR